MTATGAVLRKAHGESRDVPEHWDLVRLGELYVERKEPGAPALPVMSVTLDSGLVPRNSLERRVESDLRPSRHALVRAGDLVYNTMRMWQGASGVAQTDCMVSPAYVVAEPNDRISPAFACYLFKAPRVIRELFSYSHGITGDRLRLYFENFRQVPVCLPPLDEQRRIAVILSSVDDVMATTRKVVEQMKRVRQGLLQTLMTRGIGHTRFKKTEIGEIPETWRVVTLGDLGEWMSGSTPSRSRREFWGGHMPWVTPKDMKVPRIRSSRDRITERAVSAGARVLPQGALLVVVRGMILAHTFPVATTDLPVTINQDMKALMPADGLNTGFVSAWLEFRETAMLARVSEATHGTKRLTQRELLRFPVPYPPLHEQDEIVAAIRAAEDVVQSEIHRLRRTNSLKRGLMQDLLTGRVRVHPD